MCKPLRMYVIKQGDGLLKSGTVSELYEWIAQETGTELPQRVIGHRLRTIFSEHPLEPVALSRLLLPTGLTKSEIGRLGGHNYRVRCARFFIPELNRKVSANELWREQVQARGENHPSSKTILRRLKAGVSQLAVLLSAEPVILIPPSQRKQPAKRRSYKKKAPTGIATKPLPPWQANKEKFIQEDQYRPRTPLPPMEEWKGFDKHYYRRTEL